MGLCAGLDQLWSKDGDEPFACLGVAIADGGGSEQATVAMAFADLGYNVALLGDSDQEVSPSPDTLVSAGVTVILWADNLAVEQRLAADLPLDALLRMVGVAVGEHGLVPVRDAVAARCKSKVPTFSDDPRQWPSEVGDAEFRAAFGQASKKKGWFKRFDLAEPDRVGCDHPHAPRSDASHRAGGPVCPTAADQPERNAAADRERGQRRWATSPSSSRRGGASA